MLIAKVELSGNNIFMACRFSTLIRQCENLTAAKYLGRTRELQFGFQACFRPIVIKIEYRNTKLVINMKNS